MTSQKEEALNAAAQAYDRVDSLHRSVLLEYDQAQEANREAFKRGEFSETQDPFLGRFGLAASEATPPELITLANVKHYFGNSVIFVKRYLNTLKENNLSIDDTGEALKRLMKSGKETGVQYKQSVQNLLDAIKAHPELTKPGEEEMVARIKKDLEELIPASEALAATVKKVGEAMGISSKRGGGPEV